MGNIKNREFWCLCVGKLNENTNFYNSNYLKIY